MSRTGTTKRAHRAGAAAATATAAVESCDNPAARALAAAVAGAQPLPCRPQRSSHQDYDLQREGKPGRVGTWLRGWGRCVLDPVQVLGGVTCSQGAEDASLGGMLPTPLGKETWKAGRERGDRWNPGGPAPNPAVQMRNTGVTDFLEL